MMKRKIPGSVLDVSAGLPGTEVEALGSLREQVVMDFA